MQREIAGVNSRLRLAELLTTRLCHDLSGPIGTMMGALAMAGDDPEGSDETRGLAMDVAMNLGHRIRLVRAAWGGTGGVMSVDELAVLCKGLPQSGKIDVNFDNLPPVGIFSGGMARLLLNVLILAAESLPNGGSVLLRGDPAGTIMVWLLGMHAAWPPHFAGWMADSEGAWAAIEGMSCETARGLQGPLVALMGRDSGIRLSLLMARDAETAPPLILSPAD